MVASSTMPPIECGKCGRQFAWKSELAGRSVRCRCGNKLHVPEPIDDEEPTGEDWVAEAMFAESPAVGSACPSCDHPMEAGAVICTRCGFSMATGKKIRTQKITAPKASAPTAMAAAAPAQPASSSRRSARRADSGGGDAAGWGVTLLILGVGSFILPHLGLQFRIFGGFDDASMPWVGGVCAAVGLVLLFTGSRN